MSGSALHNPPCRCTTQSLGAQRHSAWLFLAKVFWPFTTKNGGHQAEKQKNKQIKTKRISPTSIFRAEALTWLEPWLYQDKRPLGGAVTPWGGWAGGEGLQVVQRSYFNVPSINRDPTQSGEPLKKQKPRHGRGAATVLRLQTENRLKQLHVVFHHEPSSAGQLFFFSFFFFLSTRISRWVTAPTTCSVTRHVHIFKKRKSYGSTFHLTKCLCTKQHSKKTWHSTTFWFFFFLSMFFFFVSFVLWNIKSWFFFFFKFTVVCPFVRWLKMKDHEKEKKAFCP